MFEEDGRTSHENPPVPIRPEWMGHPTLWLFMLSCLCLPTSCHRVREDPGTVVVIIESSPNNLDPRIGTDAQSEHVGGLIFDALVKKDEHFEMQPWLATKWEQPDPLTWIFHLRDGVRFQDGRPLGAADVAWTIQSLTDGSLVTPKAGAFATVSSTEVRDALTVVIHLKRPDASLLFNLSNGLFGVVPKGSGKDFGTHPVGSGPFRFVSAAVDKEVVLERTPEYWAGPAKIARLRFAVVPDAVTSALELEKGSADVASNVLTPDMVHTLEARRGIAVASGPGSPVVYLNFNVTQGPLKDKRVRQAIACAMDREAIVKALWRGRARLATTLLPPGHWANAEDGGLPAYPHDPARARALLDEAGLHEGKDGVRVRLEMKISTDETTRLLAMILLQQLRAVGIDLKLRSAEFGTFYADVTRGAFEMYSLKWIGSNEDPDIFRYAYGSDRFPPKGGNRGHYSNPRLDADLTAAASTTDERVRRGYYLDAEKILAEDVPGIPLWFPNIAVVHTARVHGIVAGGGGSFDFLRSAEVVP